MTTSLDSARSTRSGSPLDSGSTETNVAAFVAEAWAMSFVSDAGLDLGWKPPLAERAELSAVKKTQKKASSRPWSRISRSKRAQFGHAAESAQS